MLRQRLRLRTSPLFFVGRALVVIVALLLIWYGLMLVLLALKADPDVVDTLSGYRTAYDALSGIQTSDVTPGARAVVAAAGTLALVAFGYLALRELPRPYLARSAVELLEDERGTVVVEPRAIERAAEAAALEHPAVRSAAGRAGDQLTISVTLGRAGGLPATLDDVGGRVAAALERHGLPATPVEVTLTGLDRKQRRELN